MFINYCILVDPYSMVGMLCLVEGQAIITKGGETLDQRPFPGSRRGDAGDDGDGDDDDDSSDCDHDDDDGDGYDGSNGHDNHNKETP